MLVHYSVHLPAKSRLRQGKTLDFRFQYIFKRSKSMENLVLWLDRPCRTVILGKVEVAV